MKVSSLKGIMLVIIMLVLGQSVYAQADVNSPYSLFGVGQVKNKSMNVRLKGMGKVGNAMFSGSMINPANPASYAKIDSLAFLFDAGFYFKTSTFSTSSLSEKASNASFDYVAMAFGVAPWWKMALGVQPYSTAGYTMVVKDYDENVGSFSTAFKGSGGLNQAFWGNGFKIGDHFSLGANAIYVFGDSQSSVTAYFPDSTYFLASRRTEDLMVSSFMFNYGVLFNANLGNDMKIGVGLTYDQSVKLKGKKTTFVRRIENNMENDVEYIIDTIYYAEKTGSRLTMPQGIGLGVMLQKNNRWTVGADFNWMQWSKFKRDGIEESLQDSWNASVGIEYMPKHTSVSGYFTKVSYRLGGFYERSYLNINGHSLNKMGLTAGMSLPLPRSQSKVNLAIEAGRFGTKENGLVQEGYLNLSVGVSIYERWFMKRKYN